jgi:hypothetical protein
MSASVQWRDSSGKNANTGTITGTIMTTMGAGMMTMGTGTTIAITIDDAG